MRFSLEIVLLAYTAMREAGDVAGSGAARALAVDSVFAKISPDYCGALRKIPVTVRKARCVVGGVTVAESNTGWTDLPNRATAVRITTTGS